MARIVSVRNSFVLILAVLVVAITIPRSMASYVDFDNDQPTDVETEFNPVGIAAGSDNELQLAIQTRRELAIVPNVLYYCRRDRATRRRRCYRVIKLGGIKLRRPIRAGTCRNLVRRHTDRFRRRVSVIRVGQLCRFRPRSVLPTLPPPPPSDDVNAPAPSPSDDDDDIVLPPVIVDLPPVGAPSSTLPLPQAGDDDLRSFDVLLSSVVELFPDLP